MPDIPAKHKGVMIAPFIGKVDLEPYLASGQLKTVFADGENYDGARPLHYEWVKLLYDQCRKYNVPFSFFGTGNVFIKDGKVFHQLYRGNLTNEEMYERISDTLKILTTGGEEDE